MMYGWRFKLLYDGECPFCRREVDWLKRRDHAGHLAVEDIAALGFDPAKYGLTYAEVMRVLHGVKTRRNDLEGDGCSARGVQDDRPGIAGASDTSAGSAHYLRWPLQALCSLPGIIRLAV